MSCGPPEDPISLCCLYPGSTDRPRPLLSGPLEKGVPTFFLTCLVLLQMRFYKNLLTTREI